MDGGPDVLRAATLWDEAPDGRLAVKHGDSFIMFVDWDKAGQVTSQSIQPFGAATTRPESKHYTDQAPLFVAHQLKPVWFDPQPAETACRARLSAVIALGRRGAIRAM